MWFKLKSISLEMKTWNNKIFAIVYLVWVVVPAKVGYP